MSSHTPLTPASELAGKNTIRFPNESQAYRRARDALLAEEIELSGTSSEWPSSAVRCRRAAK